MATKIYICFFIMYLCIKINPYETCMQKLYSNGMNLLQVLYDL
jgi:hypothetical protein